MNVTAKKDFFVSYNRHDRAFAEWIAWILEEAGYSVVIQAWDFRPGGNFVLGMQKAASEAERTIAVLSQHYLQAEYTQPEWAAAFAQDPTGKKGILMPIRVGECELSGMWAPIVYVDLVGQPEEAAAELVRQAAKKVVTQERGKPTQKPVYPKVAPNAKPVYPPSIPENLPRLSDVFVGREEDLAALHQQVQTGKTTAICAIAGMGGIGKTELAARYAHQQREMGTYAGGVLWLRAREDVGLQIVAFARSRLGFNIPEEASLAEQVAFCWQHWQNQETLIVLDDVQRYEAIAPFLPPQRSHFKVLLTTRSHFGKPVQNYEIQVLSEATSLELLRSFVSDGRIDQELETAKQVCEWLGYLPLGLELVGRYLARKPGTSIAKLWQRLQDQRLAAKALLEAESGMTASLGVTAAFELNWQELDEPAQQLAALLSLFALAEIPWNLVQQCLPEMDEEELEDLRDRQLVNLSLLSYVGEESYVLHQLLREFFAMKRSHMEDEAMKRSFCAVMVSISQQIPQTVTLEIIEQATPAIPHLKEAATSFNSWLTDEDLITPSTRVAWFYAGQSAFGEAEKWYQHCRAIAIQRLGTEHPDVATSLNNLAELYRVQGRYEEAEPLHEQALAITQQQLGAEHPFVATSLNNLALLYDSQGRYGEAEPLYQQALAIRQQHLGSEHPDVAGSLNNLALLYWSQGRYGEAEPLYQQALAIYQQQLGDDHPNVAMSLNNLAALYYLQGRYGEAEPLYQQALAIYQQQLGFDHPDVALSLNNLAELYRVQGRYGEAEPLHQQALAIRQQQLGTEHLDVAQSLNNLALLYESQGRYGEAEPLFQQALAIYQQQLGFDHPDVALSLNNLAELYRVQGRYGEAEPLYQQALAIYQQQLGSEHPNVAQILNNLAVLYYLQGRYGEVEPLYQQALTMRQQQLGDDHPNVAQTLNNLAALYESQGRYGEAEPLCQQALAIYQQQLGDDHPDVATSLNNLAGLYRAQGRYGEAEPPYQQAITICYQRLGETHPNTQTFWNNFVSFLQEVIQSDRTAELSDHPMTQFLLQQLQNPES